MEEVKKTRFNISPSSMNTYYESPLLFFLKYIAKVPDDTEVPQCYGLSGSIVHDCLERYAKGEMDKDEVYLFLASEWKKQGLEEHKDVKGSPLDQMPYILALSHGINVVEQHDNHICEEDIIFPLIENEKFNIGMRGIIDLQVTHPTDNEQIIIDYKTSNRIDEGDGFRRQALFYTMLIHKKKGYIPKKTVFYYLKLGAQKAYSFTLEEIKEFEKEIESVANQIISYNNEIGNYPVGDISSIFNSKQKACRAEAEARRTKKFQNPQRSLDIF